MSELYSCACLNCSYRTVADMPIGVAQSAAVMHIMNEGIHTVKIAHSSGNQVMTYTNKDDKRNEKS